MSKFPENSVDLVLTDPPYGIDADKKFEYRYNDFLQFMEQVIKKVYNIMNEYSAIYIFSDYRNVHELKVYVMDKIFGKNNYLNEIIWCYKSEGFTKKKWNNKHDNILFYVKNNKKYIFNYNDVREDFISETTMKRWKKEIEKFGAIPTKKNGKIYWNNPYSLARDWMLINSLPYAHKERKFGKHPTQKPLTLIEKLVKASSVKDNIIFDMFFGSGTVGVIAEKLNRKWIGIEISKEYCEIAKQRIEEGFKIKNKKLKNKLFK